MSPSQWERGLCVIEHRRLPGCCCVAHIALLRDSCGQMVWIGRALIVLQVTRDTDRGSQIEIAIRVALIALQLRVRTGERETHCIVIEIRGLPCCSCMAFLASLRKSKRHVTRVIRLLVIG